MKDKMEDRKMKKFEKRIFTVLSWIWMILAGVATWGMLLRIDKLASMNGDNPVVAAIVLFIFFIFVIVCIHQFNGIHRNILLNEIKEEIRKLRGNQYIIEQ